MPSIRTVLAPRPHVHPLQFSDTEIYPPPSSPLPGNMRSTYSLVRKGEREREKNLELIFLSAPSPSSSPLFPPRSFSKPDSPRKLWKEFKFRGASSYNGHATKAMCHIKKFRSKGDLPAWRLFLSPGDNTEAEFSWLFICATFHFLPDQRPIQVIV